MTNIITFPLSTVQDPLNENERVVTAACLQAAEWLSVRPATLATILGVSEQTIQRLQNGGLHLRRNSTVYERARNLVNIYAALFSKIDGDRRVANMWMSNFNVALHGIPIQIIQRPAGLSAIKDHLCSTPC